MASVRLTLEVPTPNAVSPGDAVQSFEDLLKAVKGGAVKTGGAKYEVLGTAIGQASPPMALAVIALNGNSTPAILQAETYDSLGSGAVDYTGSLKSAKWCARDFADYVNSPAGQAATEYGCQASQYVGCATFANFANWAPGDTITVEGVTFTVVAANPGPYEFLIAGSNANARNNFVAALQAATELRNVLLASVSGSGSDVVLAYLPGNVPSINSIVLRTAYVGSSPPLTDIVQPRPRHTGIYTFSGLQTDGQRAIVGTTEFYAFVGTVNGVSAQDRCDAWRAAGGWGFVSETNAATASANLYAELQRAAGVLAAQDIQVVSYSSSGATNGVITLQYVGAAQCPENLLNPPQPVLSPPLPAYLGNVALTRQMGNSEGGATSATRAFVAVSGLNQNTPAVGPLLNLSNSTWTHLSVFASGTGYTGNLYRSTEVHYLPSPSGVSNAR